MKRNSIIYTRNSVFCASLSLFLILGVGSSIVPAQDVRTYREGVVAKVGTAQIQLTPVNSNTFWLGMKRGGRPEFPKSSFLADSAREKVRWSSVEQQQAVGVQTEAGELLIDPQTGQWMLKDGEGRALISKGSLNGLGAGTESGDAMISMTLEHDVSADRVYGSGNGTASLVQSGGKTRVANGVAEIPYYWTPAGYAVLAVSGNDNVPATWQEKSNGIVWSFTGTTADLFLMPAATLREAAKSYADLTGHAPVPPRWAFGYLQSRWGWKNRAYIEDTLKEFRDRHIPVDAFIYDFEWYTTTPDYELPCSGEIKFNDFSWNTNLFPELREQIADYKQQGVHFVGIRKPRLGNTANLELIRIKGWDVHGPGVKRDEKYHCRDVDFKNPKFSAWYVGHTVPLLQQGVDGWWDDEGEGTFTTYYYWNLTQADALAKVNRAGRLWTLNRAFSPGLQRLGAAAWTGDIHSTWKALADTPTSLLNWSLAGMPYSACDIGGFQGQNPSPEMLSRWMEAGVFFPVMRSHSEISRTPRFPWLYGPDAEKAIRKAIELRYQLIPYYYSLAHETYDTGVPIMRPLVMEFPNDTNVSNLSDQWLMGASLMAAPLLQPGGKRSVYLPEGRWYVFGTNTVLDGNRTMDVTAGLDVIPMYVKAGTILPLGPVIQHTSELPGGPLEVQVYPGKDAKFTFVEDDGATKDYLKGQTRRTIFSWDDSAKRLSWRTEGKYSGQDCFREIRMVVFESGKVVQMEGPLNTSGSLSAAGVPIDRSHAVEIASKEAARIYPGERLEVVNALYTKIERCWDVLIRPIPVFPDRARMIEVSADDGRIIRDF